MPKPALKPRKYGPERYSKITSKAIAALEQAFSMDCTDDEACLMAGIGRSTLYRYENDYPEFHERKQLLKQKQVLKARQVINLKLDESDRPTATWLLERKRRDEFGQQVDVNVKHINDLPLEQLEALLADALERGGYARLPDPDVIDAEVIDDDG